MARHWLIAVVLVLAQAGVIAGVGAQDGGLVDTVIRGENVRLREEPATASPEIAVLQRGDAIQVEPPGEITDEGTWWYVIVPDTGDEGWVRWQFIVGATTDPEAALLGEIAAVDASAEATTSTDTKQSKEDRKAAKKAAKKGDAPAADTGPMPTDGQIVLEGAGTMTLDPITLAAGEFVAEFGALGDATGGPIVVSFRSATDDTVQVMLDDVVGAGEPFAVSSNVAVGVEDDYVVEVECPCDQWTITLTPQN